MGLVLGPIHHWQFNKIKIAEAREMALTGVLKREFGSDAGEILQPVYMKFPRTDFTKASLEELIREKALHPGIVGLINTIETREAAIITAFVAEFGKKAVDVINISASEHGMNYGKLAAREKHLDSSTCTTVKVFELLGDYHLDGMPCDRGTQVVTESAENTSWDHIECVHKKNWDKAGASFTILCNYVNSWIAGFGKGIDPAINYQLERTIAGGSEDCLHKYEFEIIREC